MAMDFFAAQDQARRNTKLLVLLFTLAVVTLLVLTNLLLCIGLGFVQTDQINQTTMNWQQLPWSTMAGVSAIVLAVIGIVIIIKWAELRQGGHVVAKSLGGERLDYQIADAKQRQLLNVVEEMAIAAGVPVPPVYLLPETGINAFAAGYAPADAVIGITQGSLERLNRDQLQGVIAHEFSHILNGDMRMNIRLIAWLNGILFIGHAGYYLLRAGRGSTIMRAGSGSKNKNGGNIVLIAIGLIVLGYLGTFFGNLIKAAVSRQREFLADASAVQFTRNPKGLSGALKLIGAKNIGSQVKHPNADEASHFFFAEAISRWTSLFATHPPLTDRIKRLDPAWIGQFPTQTHSEPTMPNAGSDGLANFAAPTAHSTVIETLPAILLQSSRHAPTAPAVVCATLLQNEVLGKQLHLIKELGNPQLLAAVDQISEAMQSTSPLQKLQLLQISIPALKQMSASQFRHFSELVDQLIKADGQQDLLEWVLWQWLQHSVAVQWDSEQVSHQSRVSRLQQRQTEILLLLSLCADAAHPASDELQQQSWQAGLAALALPKDTQKPVASLRSVSAALPALLASSPGLKQQIWQMLQFAVQADDQQTAQEQLLLQAFAFLLEIPLGAVS